MSNSRFLGDDNNNINQVTQGVSEVSVIPDLNGSHTFPYFAAPFSGSLTAPDLSHLNINLEPIRIEAESMTIDTYRVRNNRSASGGEIISLL